MIKSFLKRARDFVMPRSVIVKTERFAINNSNKHQGKKILITGGGGGIGLSIAKKMIAGGADVVVTGRKEEKIARAVSSLGAHAQGLQWDLCNREIMEAKISEAEEMLGGAIDVLVNNAGIADRENFGSLTFSTWDRVVETNLVAPVFLSQALSNRWLARKQAGVILNISSFAGNFAVDDAYAMSKNALNEFTFGMAKRLASFGIRVNAIAPGIIAGTEINRPQSKIPADGNLRSGWIPAGRNGVPDEIAEAASYIISDAASYVHGAVLRVDGAGCAHV